MDTSANVLAAGAEPPATVTVNTGEVNEDSALSPEELAAQAAASASSSAAARAAIKDKVRIRKNYCFDQKFESISLIVFPVAVSVLQS